MSLLAPFWLAAAAVAALGVVALHLITTERPPPWVFPTARFVPPGDARAAARAARPADLPVLLLRCAALLVLGAAFAGPVTRPRGAALARVVIVDRSRAARTDVRDSALAIARAGDALVLFDTAATIVTSGLADSLRSPSSGRAPGSLSAALVAARRAARDLAVHADSVEMVIITPLTVVELDAASAGMAAGWPGRSRLVRTAAARAGRAVVALVSDQADDPLRPAIAALNGPAGGDAVVVPVRIVRRGLSTADSAAARDGAAVVSWPRADDAPAAAAGLWAGGATIVAPLVRLAIPSGGVVVARWADGGPAAAEWPLGNGCLRVVGAGIARAGDVTLQPAFLAVARSLLAPCAAAAVGAPAPDSLARAFERSGPAAGAAALWSGDERSPLAPWLLVAALLLLVGEWWLRRTPPLGAS